MKKYFIILLVFLFVWLEFFPFGFERTIHEPNTTRMVYHEDTKLKSKEDFVEFLKGNENIYKMSRFEVNGVVDWNRVKNETKVRFLLWKRYYSLDYTPVECTYMRIRMTSNGHIYSFQRCGK